MQGMKKTLHIDDEMLREAKKATGAATDTQTVRLGLEALIRHAAYERLRKLRGSETAATDVPRRRGGHVVENQIAQSVSRWYSSIPPCGFDSSRTGRRTRRAWIVYSRWARRLATISSMVSCSLGIRADAVLCWNPIATYTEYPAFLTKT